MRYPSLVAQVFLSAFGAWVTHASTSPHTYQVTINSVVSTLDPAWSRDTASSAVVTQLFDPLFLPDPSGGIKPGLAASHEVLKDRRTIRIRLREGAKFHDLRPVRAEDVRFSFERVVRLARDPLRPLDGVAEFLDGKTKHISGFKILDSSTFDLQLQKPVPTFPQLLASLTLSIVPTDFDAKLKHGILVGSGPYVFPKVPPNLQDVKSIRLTAFNAYWRKDLQIPELVLRVVGGESEALDLMRKGLLDNSHPFRMESPPTLKDWSRYEFLHGEVRYVGLNLNHPLLRDIEVRKALISIAPVREIQAALGGKKKIPSGFFMPYGLPGYIAEEFEPPMSVSSAKEVLSRVEWKGTLRLTNYLEDPRIMEASLRVCEAWTAAGISCRLEHQTLHQFVRMIEEGRQEAFVGKLMPHVPDPTSMLLFFSSRAPRPFFNLKNASIDDLLSKVGDLGAIRDRAKMFERVNRAIGEQAVVIPLQYAGVVTHWIRKPFRMPYVSIVGPYFQRLEEISVAGGS